jgi:hypothetical protein
MATQPRFPRDPGQRRPQLVPRSPRNRTKRAENIRIAVVAALAVVIAFAGILHFLRKGPQPSKPASSGSLFQQPNNDELQVVGSPQMIGNSSIDSMTLAGQVTNTGSRMLNGGQVQLEFRDQKGNPIQTVDRPMAGLSAGSCEVTNEFSQHPIKPNDLRFFCVSVSPVPSDWNHEPPDTKVVSVTSPD